MTNAVQPMPADLVVKQVILDTLSMMVLGIVAAAVNRDRLAAPFAGEEPVHA